jgi:hypothetical protein
LRHSNIGLDLFKQCRDNETRYLDIIVNVYDKNNACIVYRKDKKKLTSTKLIEGIRVTFFN